jgi:ankyrin repeat protein
LDLYEMAKKGDIEGARSQLKRKPKLALSKEGARSLHAAVECGHKDVAELLLASGVDVHSEHSDMDLLAGWTPLHYAKTKDVAEVLLAHGADVNRRSKHGSVTPLHSARTKDVAEVLLAHGADVRLKTQDGSTPLHSAKTKDVAEVLLARGADITSRNSFGWTPLHTAETSDLAEFLLSRGAEVNATSAKGETPLYFAAMKAAVSESVQGGRKIDVLEVLLAHGAELNALTADGWTPLDMALSERGVDSVQFLRERGGKNGTRPVQPAAAPLNPSTSMLAGAVLCGVGILIFVIAQATGIFFGGAVPTNGGFIASSGIDKMKGAGALGAVALMLLCFVSGGKLLWDGITRSK